MTVRTTPTPGSAAIPKKSAPRRSGLDPIALEPSLRSLAYDALKNAIMDLDVYDSPDEIKLDERRLSEGLGVSRTPIREALTILEHQGFVRAEPRRGIFVVRKTKGEIVDMIHACAAIEAMAVRLACTKATDDQLAALRDNFSAFFETDRPTDFEIYFEARWRFCRHLAVLAQSDEIHAMLDHLLLHLRGVHDVVFRQEMKLEYLRAAYVAIIAALQARDADRASHLVHERGFRLAGDIETAAAFFKKRPMPAEAQPHDGRPDHIEEAGREVTVDIRGGVTPGDAGLGPGRRRRVRSIPVHRADVSA